ncbi:hypothetical protein NL676_003292 [Syzygium grande]|nr:hypothetical protein NL676_003292 [Syzygium grande]
MGLSVVTDGLATKSTGPYSVGTSLAIPHAFEDSYKADETCNIGPSGVNISFVKAKHDLEPEYADEPIHGVCRRASHMAAAFGGQPGLNHTQQPTVTRSSSFLALALSEEIVGDGVAMMLGGTWVRTGWPLATKVAPSRAIQDGTRLASARRATASAAFLVKLGGAIGRKIELW